MIKTDKEVQEICLASIRRTAMDLKEWRYTQVASIHAALANRIALRESELAVVCSYISDESWYLFTTRRLLCRYGGASHDLPIVGLVQIAGESFPNFKGYGGQKTEVTTLRTPDGQQVRFEYETGKASMAPIYALRYLCHDHYAPEEG